MIMMYPKFKVDRHLVHEVTSPVSNLMLRDQQSQVNPSDSKLSRGSEMLVEESVGRTAPLLPLIMYSFSFSLVQISMVQLTP